MSILTGTDTGAIRCDFSSVVVVVRSYEGKFLTMENAQSELNIIM